MLARLLLLALAGALACTTASDRFQRAVEDAEAGRSGGWHVLCHAYTYGEETSVDYEKARTWCARAADWGDPASKAVMGDLYFRGDGGDLDPARAFQLYMEAAELGDGHGTHMVGVMYNEGLGVERDREAGAEWLLKARKRGYRPRSVGRRRTLTPAEISRAAPCRYQGTYHKTLRWEIEQRRMGQEISESAWLCQARALEAMDRDLRSACPGGLTAAQPVLNARAAAFEECEASHPVLNGGN